MANRFNFPFVTHSYEDIQFNKILKHINSHGYYSKTTIISLSSKPSDIIHNNNNNICYRLHLLNENIKCNTYYNNGNPIITASLNLENNDNINNRVDHILYLLLMI